MKITTIIGARPQFIKAAIVSRILQSASDINEILVHTGQHYDQNMSGAFFEELEIPQPNYNLEIGSGSHGVQTGRMLEAIEKVLLQEQPDWIIVYGDTNSTLAGAIAAAKLHIPIAHVEAGLRSFNRRMPEEINRVLTDHTSDLLFAPTETAVSNLVREGVSEEKTHLVGDVMYDAALYYGTKAQGTSNVLNRLKLFPKKYVLATIHRAENTDTPSRLQAIFDALSVVAKDLTIVLPLHPRTHKALHKQGKLEIVSQKILLIEPVGYLDMVMLEKNANLIVTDSGGVQKEAFFHRVPCVTLREETEWRELVELGWNRLVPPVDSSTVKMGIIESLTQNKSPTTLPELYGRGQAAAKIKEVLLAS